MAANLPLTTSPMVELRSGDLFTASVEVLVNPTNARGVSGAGLALEFKKRYPVMAKAYTDWCQAWHVETGRWPVGQCFYWEIPGSENLSPKAIVCLPTKDSWQEPARLPWIRAGLDSLITHMRGNRLHTVAMPALGCGLGGLQLTEVQPVIDRAFYGTNFRAIVYANAKQLATVAPRSEPAVVRNGEAPEFRGPVRPVLARSRHA